MASHEDPVGPEHDEPGPIDAAGEPDGGGGDDAPESWCPPRWGPEAPRGYLQAGRVPRWLFSSRLSPRAQLFAICLFSSGHRGDLVRVEKSAKGRDYLGVVVRPRAWFAKTFGLKSHVQVSRVLQELIDAGLISRRTYELGRPLDAHGKIRGRKLVLRLFLARWDAFLTKGTAARRKHKSNNSTTSEAARQPSLLFQTDEPTRQVVQYSSAPTHVRDSQSPESKPDAQERAARVDALERPDPHEVDGSIA